MPSKVSTFFGLADDLSKKQMKKMLARAKSTGINVRAGMVV